MTSFDAWIFRKRRGFCLLYGLNKTNLVKSAFLSIHAPAVGSNQRNSSQSAQPTETEGRRTMSKLFEQMSIFSALICLSFLSWSILNLKEKSGRVILAELNSFEFPSHVVNKHTGLEIHRQFSKCGHAGRRHSSKEILRIVMFRTPELLNIQNLQE